MNRQDAPTQAEFHETISTRSDRWYSACLKITRNRDLAEDAVQDALLSAWNKRHQFAQAILFAKHLGTLKNSDLEASGQDEKLLADQPPSRIALKQLAAEGLCNGSWEIWAVEELHGRCGLRRGIS